MRAAARTDRNKVAVLVTLASVLAGLVMWSPPAWAGQECLDKQPGGGDLGFAGIGEQNQTVTRFGDVCPGESETWTFKSLDARIRTNVAVRVLADSGDFSFTFGPPGSNEPVSLEPNQGFIIFASGLRHYEVTITGRGEGIANYRLGVCRGVFGTIEQVCQYSDEETAKPGDVSCDGVIDSTDALLILQRSADLIMALPCATVGEIFLDQNVNAKDATLILQLEAGLIDQLPLAHCPCV